MTLFHIITKSIYLQDSCVCLLTIPDIFLFFLLLLKFVIFGIFYKIEYFALNNVLRSSFDEMQKPYAKYDICLLCLHAKLPHLL